MQFCIFLIILPLVTNYAVGPSDTSKNPLKDTRPRTTTLKPPVKSEATTDTKNNTNSRNNSLQQYSSQSQKDTKVHAVLPIQPRTVTKLAKTYYLGLSPSFKKDYFEPFERRVRPIMLVAFRKNGFAPRHILKASKSTDAAELQSPYNDISTFWQDEPELKIKLI